MNKFEPIKFKDEYGVDCSLQKSRLDTQDCIWLGLQKVGAEGGRPARMHLTREMVSALLPALHRFVDTGELE